ncbi:caspase family protein [Corallococcus exiguus]|uniref:caspase family protein n=1 Tax=Corallococcus TaxID=83461 RepID=UPI000EBD3DC2|nr:MULTISPECIES: caspase family protein [Corallococcus]NNC16935.1 caspase family protein [Corallococcus exiguus]RKI19294.1 caspase family protein [Corallococcus sp. AB030]
MSGFTRACLLVMVSWLMAATARAGEERATPPASRRMAVIVGSNAAVLGRAALRYAHDDARRVADVLSQVGEFRAEDVVLLLDPAPEAILAALDQQLASLRSAPGDTLLLFYYSGHADQQALYPQGAPLLFTALKQRIESPDATVRVGIIDACRGGGWTQAKGLHAEAPFALEVPLRVQSTGSVLIASSSGLENAHETEALEGSFFTHHLVAGLRGAADVAGDGEVSLVEAFTYAKQLTIRDTAVFAERLQHPSFDMNLRGREDLALTHVDTGGSIVMLLQRWGPLEVVLGSTGKSVVELPEGKRQVRMSLRPGRYLLVRKDPDRPAVREFSVQAAQSLLLDEEQMVPASFSSIVSKGLDGSATTWDTGTPHRLLMLHPLSLAFEVMFHLEYAQALSPSWSFTLEPMYWQETGDLKLRMAGLDVGAHYHLFGNAPAGLFIGWKVGASAVGFDVGSDGGSTIFTLHQGLDVGYTLLFWNRLVLSLGVGVGYVVSTGGDLDSSFEPNPVKPALGSRRPQLGFSSSYRVAAGVAF